MHTESNDPKGAGLQAAMPEPYILGGTLFLDVAGVIAPNRNPRGGEPSTTVPATGPSRLGENPQPTLTISPAVRAALERVMGDFDLELVFLTTGNEEHSISLLTAAIGSFQKSRSLLVAPSGMTGSPYLSKVEAIVRDLGKSPSRFICVDADMGSQGKETLNALPVSSLLIELERAEGLTKTHLLSMRQFLEETVRSGARMDRREQRVSLELHREVLRRLLENPAAVLGVVPGNLRRLRANVRGDSGESWLNEWETLAVTNNMEGLRSRLLGVDRRSIDMRQVSPFSTVLTQSERLDAIYRASNASLPENGISFEMWREMVFGDDPNTDNSSRRGFETQL
ncbi:hypothetical protein [Frigoribacterium sp. UYMn621]|uniref:hypothetical protein n=1 Tax=Frigoribacterium sp. UYMn621 TaxID=3156343 RepID=UPI00339272E9